MRYPAIFTSAVVIAGLTLAAAEARPGKEEETPSTAAYQKAMEAMHHKMMISYSGDADADFAAGMIPHHQGAVDMANIELRYGKDPELRTLARKIVDSQNAEIDEMRHWQKSHAARE